MQVEARVVNPITPEKALENAEVVFARLQAKGASVAMRHLPDGQWAVVAVRPELEDSAPDCARAALEGPKEQTLEDKLELTASVEATVVKGASPEAQPQGDDMDDDDIA